MVTASIFTAALTPGTAQAWCAANCIAKCKMTTRPDQSVSYCIAKNNCSQYTGPCESARSVQNGARNWQQSRNGNGVSTTTTSNAGTVNGKPHICRISERIGGSPQLVAKKEEAGCFR
jgi:hypothetical protein